MGSRLWRGNTFLCRSPWRFFLIALGVLFLAALLALLASRHPWATERLFSRGVYPILSATFARSTGALPFCLLEWLLAGLVGFLAWRGLRGLQERKRRERSWGRLLLHGIMVMAGLGALAFGALIFLWGLNLYRPPLRQLMGWPAVPVSGEELVSLGQELALESATLKPEEALLIAFQRDLSPGFDQLRTEMPWMPSRIPAAKVPLVRPLLPYFGAMGVYGVWTGEPLVDGSAPPWILPALRAHEMAHGAGFVREDEANFLAWSACRVHPDPAIRHSGALTALLEVRRRIVSTQPQRLGEVDRLLSPLCREEIRQLFAWHKVPKPTARMAMKAYDHLLKAQGQTQGIASYGLAVDLLLAERKMRRGIEPSPTEP